MALCPSCRRLPLQGSSSFPRAPSPLTPHARSSISSLPLQEDGLVCSPPRRNLCFRAAAPAPPLPQLLAPHTASSKFADALGNLHILCSEVGEERRAAAECIQQTSQDAGGRSAEDYGRRAQLFARSGEMAASSKLKCDRVFEELELLQSEVMQHDNGRAALDYLLRAELFNKSAEVFGQSCPDG